ncbi:MAG: hypothetical protein MZV63_65375 [Marinilabiliales bacterium]|nr:hypothetical protein [Marinilabiliales bacterium]
MKPFSMSSVYIARHGRWLPCCGRERENEKDGRGRELTNGIGTVHGSSRIDGFRSRRRIHISGRVADGLYLKSGDTYRGCTCPLRRLPTAFRTIALA